jgi:hypothetical protein
LIHFKRFMRILNLIIKQQYFNEILKGVKNDETRIIKANYCKRYLLIDNEKGTIHIRAYDAIKLFVGYHTNRTSILILVESIHLDFRNEKVISALANGVSMNIVYKLGDIIEFSNKFS